MALDSYTYWTNLTDEELTVDNVTQALRSIPDDLWAVAAVSDRTINAVEVQRILLELGIARTSTALKRSQEAANFAHTPPSSFIGGDDANSIHRNANETTRGSGTLYAYFVATPEDAQLCSLRATLLHRLDRLNTFVEASKGTAFNSQDEPKDDIEEEWDDDPWAEEARIDERVMQPLKPFPISLSTFLVEDLGLLACHLASLQWFDAIRVLQARHQPSLYPVRLSILDSIPEHVYPSALHDILPAFDVSTNSEPPGIRNPWRQETDWSELDEVQTVLKAFPLTTYPPRNTNPVISRHLLPTSPLTAEELSAWYKGRVDRIISTTGLIDVALAIIQHGASQGIPGLDEIGEELSLLSRLVYDAPRGLDTDDDWTLSRWSSMQPSEVVQAYLAHSTPESISTDIARLALPYLFVLESRAERTGTPDPDLPSRLLHQYILSAPLEITAAIFEASKPTLPASQRLIKDDKDMTNLALACLYGSDSLHEWSTMSRIFECLPAWDVPHDEDDDVMDTTISSLGAFVTPSTDHPHCTTFDLLVFFKPLPIASLSRALDILDVHLESGEILSRWSVPAPLRWFLQSHDNAKEQNAWANRMARRAGGSDDQLTSKDDWEWLLEDMLKLASKGDTGLRGAFGLLTRDEIFHLFFSGLLSSGKFDIARDILHSSPQKLLIEPSKIEEICLECSREFYDNAQSGNYKFGDLKLAYDCLSVPPPTDRIIREREFIEATSRISSFNVLTRPGIPISPIEIRLTTDRLSLISRVLSSNNDAYKHSEVILDLVHKLGYKDDVVAEVKTLAMLADTALQAEDFARAYRLSERMVDRVHVLRDSPTSASNTQIAEACEVCWVACYQLGRQPEFEEMDKKLSLLGQALELCPPEKLHDVLSSWGRLAKDDINLRESRLSSADEKSIATSISRERTLTAPGNVASSLRARLQELHMPSPPLLSTPDAAALASRTFRSVTANFPFSVGRGSQASDRDSGSRAGSLLKGDGEDVSAQASRVFNKGIGWLIGAEDE